MEFNTAQKKIIFTDRVAKVNKRLRTANLKDGKDCLNVTVMSLKQAATELVQAYSALREPGKHYQVTEFPMQVMILAVLLKRSDYSFLPEESKGIETTKEILSRLNQIRKNTPTEEFTDSKDQKISELKDIIDVYEKRLLEKDQLDEVLLYRKCIEMSKEKGLYYTFMPYLSDAQIFLDEEYELTGIERDFLTALLQGFDRTMADAQVLKKDAAGPEEYRFFKAYGAANEVRYVAERIIKDGLVFGDTAVMFASPVYERFLRAGFEEAGIPYVFPDGMNVSGSDYVQFMRDVLLFARDDFSYETLYRVVKNPLLKLKKAAFLYRYVLKYGIGWKRQRYLDFIEGFEKMPENEEIKKQEGIAEFIGFLRDITGIFDEKASCEAVFGMLVSFAKKYIYDGDEVKSRLSEKLKLQGRVFSLADPGNSLSDNIELYEEFFESLTLDDKEEPDRVSLIPYGRRDHIDRKNLFVLGLSNENTAGNLADSPVLTDDELKRYVTGKLDLSLEKNRRKREEFENTLGGMRGGTVTLGYSIYDTVRLAENSASDIFLEKLDLAGMSESDIAVIGYDIFEKDLKIFGDDLIKHMREKSERRPDPEQEITDNKNADDIPVFSATLLQMLLHCPLSYIYRKVYRVPRPEFSKRISYRWLEPNQRGNILHHVFEKYADDVFIENCRGYDEAFLKKIFDEEIEEMKHLQPVPSETVFEDEKEECYEAARVYAGRMHGLLDAPADGRKVIGCEVGFDGLVHEGKTYRVSFTGSIDRLDGYVKDGVLNLAIVDYKTGRPKTLKDEIEDFEQIQHYIYALAAFRVCRERKEELEKRFGERIDSISIASMTYEFPFEAAGENIIDVSKAFAGKTESGIKLPDSVEAMLERIVGNIQQGRLEEAKQCALAEPAKGCEYCAYTEICRAKIEGVSL